MAKQITRAVVLGATAALLGAGMVKTPAAFAAPDRSVVAGANIPSATFAFKNHTRTCTHHVSTTGNDSNVGSSAAPWQTPAKAFATLRDGQTACIHAGTYDIAGPLNPLDSGTASAPISVIGAPGEARPVLRATRDSNLIEFGPGDSYWVVQGVTIDKNRHDDPAVQVLGSPTGAGPAHHIAIRNSAIRNSKSAAAVLVRNAATDILIEGNRIRDHQRWEHTDPVTHELLVAYTQVDDRYKRADANAVSLESTTIAQVARVRVARNELDHNSGDGVQCQGVHDVAGAHTNDPIDLDAVDNRIHHNTENAIDIKSCQRVSIRGSRSPAATGPAADNKFYGFHSEGAIILHFFARGVLVENTRIWDTCTGIAIGRQNDGVQDVVVRRTLVFGLVAAGCPSESGLRVTRADRVDIYHNSFVGIPFTALQLGSDNADTVSNDIDVFDNIIETTNAGWWIDLHRPAVTGFESQRNLFWHPDNTGAHLRLDLGATTNLANWRSATRQDTASKRGNPQWVTDPMKNDYYTSTTSPARDSAAPVPGQAFCGNAPDTGFRETCDPAPSQYTITRVTDPARSVVTDSQGWVATFTDGSSTVTLRGPQRTFTERTAAASVTHRTWVRLLRAPFQGTVDERWLTQTLQNTSSDVLAAGMQYIEGAPAVHDASGLAIAGDANYGPVVNGAVQEGSDFNDYLGIAWSYPSGPDNPEADQRNSLDCSGFVRMLFGYRGGLPLARHTSDGTQLPRRAHQMIESAPGRVLVPDTGSQVTRLSTLAPGDLVFFDAATNDGNQIDHVGLYLGLDADRHHRFLSSRKTINGPTLGDQGGKSLLDGTGFYASHFRAVRRL
jgi:hypothetical protein